MISRAFAQAVELINPGEPVPDADRTTSLPGAPTTTQGRADLWQLNVEQQVLDGDGTVLADWQGIFPAGDPVTAETQVRDVASGAMFRVHGQPQTLTSLRTWQPDHIEARLKFISDQQGDPS